MNNLESKYLTLKYGMHLRYIKRLGFKSSFAMFSVKYGSSDFNFILDGKEYKTKPGIAHFIEHKCFAMPDGSDAFYKFSKLGASANAYTTYDRTIYYFKTVDDLYEPLGLLIDMMLSKGFTKENIEREKSIICNEINMYSSNIDYKMETLTMKNMFLNTGYSYDIAGDVKDVKATTLEDILINYEAFYHPKNLILTVVGDFDEAKLVEFVNSYLDKYIFPDHNVISLANIRNITVDEEIKVLKKNNTAGKFSLGIRLDMLNDYNPFDTLYYDFILGILSSDSSKIYQKLINNEVINPGVYYEIHSNKALAYALLIGTANNPIKAVNQLKKTIKELKLSDLNIDDFNNFKKYTYSYQLANFDNIQALGEMVSDYDIDDIDFFLNFNDFRNIEFTQINKYLDNFKNAKISATVIENSLK